MTFSTNRRSFISRAATVLATAAIIPMLASCGGSTSTKSTATKPAAASETGKEHIVEISGFKFGPASLAVKPGDTVTWINRDSAPHTATATDSSWDTGTIAPNGRKSVKMTSGMVSSYFCRFHPMMKATLSGI